MANIEYGLLKLAAAKASGMAFPMGLVAVAAIWVWSARNRRSVPPRDDSSATTGSIGEADPGGSPREAAGSAHPTARARTSYRPVPGAPCRGGTDREALLSQILEDNIRLREALK
jgi:hypothetical protein